MDDFEQFKKERLRLDPSARKLSDSQWEQAYAAHHRAKERVAGGQEANRREGGRRGSSRKGSGSGSTSGSGKSKRARGGLRDRDLGGTGWQSLRRRLRGQSAYADLRLLVDLLAWIAVGCAALSTIIKLFYHSASATGVVALLDGVPLVIAMVVGRLLAQVLIDRADVALYEADRSGPSSAGSVSTEDADSDEEA